MKLIYLDNAATTYPKPNSVADAVSDSFRLCGGNPGRASHSQARASAEAVYDCRCAAASMFGCEPENVIFTVNTTAAINMALKCRVRSGDRILTGSAEHNSVARPVAELVRRGIATSAAFNSGGKDDDAITDSIKAVLSRDSKILVCAHVSNICGLTVPLDKIGQICREHGLFFIVDAAQSAGTHHINMKEMNIDALCVPGHKGLCGPMGCGMLLLRSADGTSTVTEGGSGINSLDPYMPDVLPERFEAGTLPVPTICGLLAGMEYVSRRGVCEIFRRECELARKFIDGLRAIDGVKLYLLGSGSTVLFNIGELSSEETARRLDSDYKIAVRGGFHCAPMAHKLLGTPDHGAVRASFGPFYTESEMKTAVAAVKELAAESRRFAL